MHGLATSSLTQSALLHQGHHSTFAVRIWDIYITAHMMRGITRQHQASTGQLDFAAGVSWPAFA